MTLTGRPHFDPVAYRGEGRAPECVGEDAPVEPATESPYEKPSGDAVSTPQQTLAVVRTPRGPGGHAD